MLRRYAVGIALLLWTPNAYALPATQTATGDDGEAWASLTMWEDSIQDDVRTRCQVELSVSGQGTPFVDGDTIQVRIMEDDGIIGDDLLWQEVFDVSSRELELQQVTRGFDCSFPVPGDLLGDHVEIYAQVTAVKEESCFLCNYDRAQTANIRVRRLEDDNEEDNDTLTDATVLDAQRISAIAADVDWYYFRVDQVSEVRLTVDYFPDAGELDIAVFDSNQRAVGVTEDTESGVEILLADAEVGGYRARIAPVVAQDFNFYDVGVGITALDVECTPGDEETAACGRCGTRQRVCGQDRRWTSFGPCEGQGDCNPGDGRVNVCGNCGTVTESCNSQCAWESAGDCTGEGECPRGETESRSCDGGSEVRTCDNACQWRDWGPCQGDECESGDVRACYTGPEGTATVGVCESGRQVCNLGRWSVCEGEVYPSPEDCDDTRDNDCDGDVDVADSDCGLGQSEVGGPCATSAQCAGDMLCVGPPEHSQFIDGYCGDDDCRDDGDCGGGICAGVFGGQFCLAVCALDTDCRAGYLCADVEEGRQACVPRCTVDAHCGDPENPFCDAASGLCVVSDPNGMSGGGGDGQSGGDTVTPRSTSRDDGCSTTPGAGMLSVAWPLLRR